jgi:hypothetical protein
MEESNAVARAAVPLQSHGVVDAHAEEIIAEEELDEEVWYREKEGGISSSGFANPVVVSEIDDENEWVEAWDAGRVWDWERNDVKRSYSHVTDNGGAGGEEGWLWDWQEHDEDEDNANTSPNKRAMRSSPRTQTQPSTANLWRTICRRLKRSIWKKTNRRIKFLHRSASKSRLQQSRSQQSSPKIRGCNSNSTGSASHARRRCCSSCLQQTYLRLFLCTQKFRRNLR